MFISNPDAGRSDGAVSICPKVKDSETQERGLFLPSERNVSNYEDGQEKV